MQTEAPKFGEALPPSKAAHKNNQQRKHQLKHQQTNMNNQSAKQNQTE
jgi:hypothetical protein